MSVLLRAALVSSVFACSIGCTFFQLDEKDLEVPPKKPEAAAGKAGEAAAGATSTNAGGTGMTAGDATGGMAPTAAGGGGVAGM